MQQIIKLCLFGVSLLPFFNSKQLIFGAVFSKTIIFSFIISIVGILLAIQFYKNKDFQESFIGKVKDLLKSKIFIAFNFFVLFSFLSTLFAVDQYLAFWGTLERFSGFFSIILLYLWFIFSVLIFKVKDWKNFFKVNIILGTVVIIGGIISFLSTGERPIIFMGNPTFFAEYVIFITAIAGIIVSSVRESFWRFVSGSVILLGLIGILISGMRSALLGVILGFLSIAFYYLIIEKDRIIFNYSAKKIIFICIALLGIFIGSFISTKNAPFWQSVPGFSRLALIGTENNTTMSRLILWKTGIESINPKNHPKEFLIGWGIENAHIPLGKYYDPEIYKYDTNYFDRAHNQFLDKWIMSGILGFIAYSLIIIFSFYVVIKNKNIPVGVRISLLWFFVSYVIHVFFSFDQIPGVVFFFALIAFAAHYFLPNTQERKNNTLIYSQLIMIIVFIILTVFIFFRGVLPGWVQLRHYYKFFMTEKVELVNEKMFYPFSFAQISIRKDFILDSIERTRNIPLDEQEKLKNLFLLQTGKRVGEEYLQKVTTDYRFYFVMGELSKSLFDYSNNPQYLIDSENYMTQGLSYAPNRLDFLNNLTYSLVSQGKFTEAMETVNIVMEKYGQFPESYIYRGTLYFLMGENFYKQALQDFEYSFSLKSKKYNSTEDIDSQLYEKILVYFYNQKDKENFLIAANRLTTLENYEKKELIQNIVKFINENKKLPVIKFQ